MGRIMCEFCVKHGDGRRWYLNAVNYSEELLRDPRRRKYIREFIPHTRREAGRWLAMADRAHRLAPRLTRFVGRRKAEKMKSIHYGQVIPLEDVAAVMAVAGHVVRLPCVCRKTLLGRDEALCYAVAASPANLGLADLTDCGPEGLDVTGEAERVAPGDALREMAALEKRGCVHTVWTFITPFIGAICNCDPAGCLAVNFTGRGFPLYLPGEWRASVDRERCSGCGACLRRCIFGAMERDGETVRVVAERCHGCGICRVDCARRAIDLRLAEGAAGA
jgi:NAD-dependent dihydropyrimidine dehydrogenase PreA subunit